MVAPVTNWEKFRLLLWKNWILQLSSKWSFFFVVALPLIFTLLLVLIRSLVVTSVQNEIRYRQQDISNLDLFKHGLEHARKINEYLRNYFQRRKVSGGGSVTVDEYPIFELYYSPKNPLLDEIVKQAAASLELEDYHAFDDAQELEKALVNTKVLGGIQFEDWMSNITEYPQKLSYSVRFPSELRTTSYSLGYTWLTMRLFPKTMEPGPRNYFYDDGGIPVGYLREGFLPVQNAISMAFLQLASNVTQLPEVVMKRFPYPSYVFDPLLVGLPSIMSLMILLSFIYPAGSIIKSVTVEKEKQLKEVMKIMGLQNWLHWSAWFVKAFISWTISSIIICAFYKIQTGNGASILTNSCYSAVLFFFLFYITASICFCFMMAVFFSKASTAAAVSGLIWFIFYVPFSVSVGNYEDLSLGSKLFYCLFSNSAMGFGIKLILDFEGTGEGLQWSNLFKTSSVDEDFTVGACMGMMLLSSVIYMLICLYIEKIFPGEYGMPKKWYFPFTKEFYCGAEQYHQESGTNIMNDVHSRNSAAFETEPVGKNVGLCVKNLKKTFGPKTAVKDLSVNMYEDEITVLLGHNGAGKTTTISMLTGMFPPTAGTAIVNGYDIRESTEEARSSMGICPQHNVLFDEMSVENHLVFFSRLKGARQEAIQAEVQKYLKILELENKAKEFSKNLSGGMKRKLSVCCALCGDTKVVLCDEPSSGMDPAARRQLWDLLQAEKIGRTVLLTTHFMDEADVLGDRIAIMCGGELKCSGSSFFLKKKYGSGYRLICVKREDCRVDEVTNLLNQFIPELKPQSNIGAELTYLLPEDYSPIFEDMFAALESKSDELHLSGYGIGITSMEEVFMKVGAENNGSQKSESTMDIMNGNGYNHDIEAKQSNDIFTETSHLLSGKSLLVNQWNALFLKKILYTWRNKIAFLIQLLIPILYVIITVIISTTQGTYATLKPIVFLPTQYPITSIVLETQSDVVEDSLQANVSRYYEMIVKSYGKQHTFESTGNEDFEDYIMNVGEKWQVRVNARYVAAATVTANTITAWLNNQPYHTAPLTVNLVHDAMAKALLGPEAGITVANAPLPYSTKSELSRLNVGNNLGTQLATNLCFSMCFVSAFYVLFAIKERVSRAKLLQFVSGVEVWSFWITQFIWDMATFTFTSFVTIATIACFQEENLSTFSELGRSFLVLFIFQMSVLPFTYLISFTAKEPASGFSRASIISIFAGMALYITYTVMSFEFFDTKKTADTLVWFFRIVPHFSLANGINRLFTNSATRMVCENVELPEAAICQAYPQCCNIQSYFAWTAPGILPEIIYMLGTSVVYFIIIILSEYQLVGELIHKLRKKIMKTPPPLLPTDLDDDVERERKRIFSMSTDELLNQNLVLDRVTKYYGAFIAVNQISLGVKSSECFGLLGVNGAGKTTTFKMMTGDERISYGEAYVRGMSLKRDMNDVYKVIGYCPQFDALLDDITGRETLRIFSLLRGVPKGRIDELITKIAEAFGFTKHLDKPTKAFSGGNKRKLSTAIAVIGSPSVIYLDEPTTGMDPAARRQLWNMVCRIRDSGKSIVLTSHSMEECEALCTRLAVMVNGEFKCIGSTQHLKNKFSKGLVLKIKVKQTQQSVQIVTESQQSNLTLQRSSMTLEKDPHILRVKNFVEHEFPQSKLQEEYLGVLTFYIPLSEVKWSRIFGLMERNRNELNIEDYSITQTTLEQIFLDFAKLQREDKRVLK